MKIVINNALQECVDAINFVLKSDEIKTNIAKSAEILINSIKNEKNVYACGNGGSMAEAIHFAEEMTGRFRKDRPALPGIAISDAGHISCTANDMGYQSIFSRFIEGNAKTGDILVCISTSGESSNVISAAIEASKKHMRIISITGKKTCTLAKYSDICISADFGKNADRIQELHVKIVHILIELIERELFPANYEKQIDK